MRTLDGQAGDYSLTVSAGPEPFGGGGSHQVVRAALGGASLPERLSEEISELDEQLDRLVSEAAPELVAVEGVGTDTAASLLIAAGDNPERLENEAAFAHPCAVRAHPGLFRQDRRPPPSEPPWQPRR